MKEEQVRSKMILQIHDELIFDVLLEEKEKMLQIVEEGHAECHAIKSSFGCKCDIWQDLV